MVRGAKLTNDQRIDVVTRLAGYETPFAVMESLHAQFGIRIAQQSIEFYDPTKHAGRKLSKRWRTLFWEIRKRIIKSKARSGFANKMTRVRALERMARLEIDAGNSREARALLAQIAKEMSESPTSKRKHEHSRPDSVPFTPTVIVTVRPHGGAAPPAGGGIRKPGH